MRLIIHSYFKISNQFKINLKCYMIMAKIIIILCTKFTLRSDDHLSSLESGMPARGLYNQLINPLLSRGPIELAIMKEF